MRGAFCCGAEVLASRTRVVILYQRPEIVSGKSLSIDSEIEVPKTRKIAKGLTMAAIICQDRISRRLVFLISFDNSEPPNRERGCSYESGTYSITLTSTDCGRSSSPNRSSPPFLRTTIYVVCVGCLMWGAVLAQTRDILLRSSVSVSISINAMSKVRAEGTGEIS
jgi:hypothetical protein